MVLVFNCQNFTCVCIFLYTYKKLFSISILLTFRVLNCFVCICQIYIISLSSSLNDLVDQSKWNKKYFTKSKQKDLKMFSWLNWRLSKYQKYNISSTNWLVSCGYFVLYGRYLFKFPIYYSNTIGFWTLIIHHVIHVIPSS